MLIYLKNLHSQVSRFVILLLVLTSVKTVDAQDCVYRSPLDGPTVLSGSYGEPRTRHFHAGIDYKRRRGIPYDTIRAVADGYVSRINVRPDGYGNALYIDHPCGQTSVYAHLYVFAPAIKDYIEDIQYQQQKNAIVHNPAPDRLPVKAGDPIGVMGSTGRSSGPHLHFEIRDTKSEASINPALYGFKPNDNIAPVIRGVIIYSLTPDGQELTKTYHPAFMNGSGYALKTPDIAVSALTVGVGIHTYDTMNGATNHNGIYSLNLTVDGEGQYAFRLDSLSFETSQYIHSHMDYEAKMDNKYYTKCFQNPGNPLPIYDQRGEGGYISIYEFKQRQVDIVVGDIEGNISKISFAVRRSTDLLSTEAYAATYGLEYTRISPDDSLHINGRYTDITLSPHSVATPLPLHLDSDEPSIVDLTQDHDVPIFRYIKVAQKAQAQYPKSQYCFISTDDKGKVTKYGVNWQADSVMVAYLPKLSRYEVAIDSVAPTISVLSLPGQGRPRCKFKLTDNYETAYSRDALVWEVRLDGDWVLCQHDIKSNTIWFDMSEPMTDKLHTVKLSSKDSAGNKVVSEKSFRY